jgi:hypothetical protein
MKFVNFYRKPISMFVMVSFTVLLCFWANQAPAAPVSVKNAETTMEQEDNSNPNFIEQENNDAAAVKKPKKFPWLLVGAVVVVGAAALYFLVIKKTEYTLTVSLGAGTSGTPATGKYKKGEVVAYSFSTQAGYGSLMVMLDGAEVPAAGNVTMDKDHTLAASATQGATLQVNSTPAGAKIYVDKVDSGQVTPHTFNYTAAATKEILVSLCGYQDYSKTQSLALGQTATIDATLPAGILDNFLVANSCWQPHTASQWTVVNGVYKFVGSDNLFNYSIFSHSFDQSNWTAEVKMKRVVGVTTSDNAVVLIEKMSGTKAYGYWFSYLTGGQRWFIIRFDGYDMFNGGGSYRMIANGPGSRINKGLNQWNTLKVVRSGTNFNYYINGTLVRSFLDNKYNPHYLALGMVPYKKACEMQYDYVKLSFPSTVAVMPAEPFCESGPAINWPGITK